MLGLDKAMSEAEAAAPAEAKPADPEAKAAGGPPADNSKPADPPREKFVRKFKAKKRQSYLEAITEEYLTEAKYFTNKHKQTAPLRKAMRKDKWFDHTGLFKKVYEGTFEDTGGADRPFTVWRPSSEEMR